MQDEVREVSNLGQGGNLQTEEKTIFALAPSLIHSRPESHCFCGAGQVALIFHAALAVQTK